MEQFFIFTVGFIFLVLFLPFSKLHRQVLNQKAIPIFLMDEFAPLEHESTHRSYRRCWTSLCNKTTTFLTSLYDSWSKCGINKINIELNNQIIVSQWKLLPSLKESSQKVWRQKEFYHNWKRILSGAFCPQINFLWKRMIIEIHLHMQS